MDNKLSIKEKISFAFGDVGCNFVWTTVSMFLILYYTDSVGISAGIVGTIMLFTRLFDGVTDLGFGTILDRTHTKWGKARPWILWSTPMMAIGLILTFNVPGGLGDSGKIVYATITYVFVAAFAYTASNLAYNALLSLMTDNQQERTVASTLRFIFTFITAIVLSSITMPLVNSIGWGMTSVVFAVLATICFMITFFGTKERHTEEAKKDTPVQKDVSVLEGFRLLFKNRYFISITLLFVAVYAMSGLASGVGIFYAKDILQNENLFGLMNMVNMVPMLFVLPLFPVLAKKWGKWKCMMTGMILMVVGSLIMLAAPTNPAVIIVGLIVKGLGMGPNTAGLFALVADGVVYGEWKNGVRQDGLFNSATSFGMKVGTGLGSAMVGWGLELSHYEGTLAVQSETTLNAIMAMYIVLPLILVVIGIICLGFSNLDKIYPEIMKSFQNKEV